MYPTPMIAMRIGLDVRAIAIMFGMRNVPAIVASGTAYQYPEDATRMPSLPIPCFIPTASRTSRPAVAINDPTMMNS